MSGEEQLESGVDDVSDASGVSPRSLAEPPAVQLGHVLDKRYRLDAAIGHGGMGWVFRATDLRLQRAVAVKVLPPNIAADPAMRKRFEREALASSRMSSPHIVVIHDFGQDGDVVFLVMELLEGRTLRRAMAERGALPIRQAVEIGAGIARALVHAHGAGVAHRDLKPSNVFLPHDGEKVKVLDFGIAKLVDEPAGPASMTLTTTGTLMGTPLYMSPEAIKRGATVGPPADLYGLGLLLYQMLVGRPPFSHDEPVVVLGMHVRDEAPRLRDALPHAPPALDALIDRLLAKAPDERPTAAEVVRELSSLDLAAVTRDDPPATDPSVPTAPPRGSLPPPPDPETIPSAPDLALAFEDAPTVAPGSAAPPSVSQPPSSASTRIPWWLVGVVGGGAAVFGLGLVIAILALGDGEPGSEPADPGPPIEAVEAEPVEVEAPTPPVAAAREPETVQAEPAPPPEPVEAEPAPPPEPEPATLDVTSDVPAAVEVDGEARGTTPTSLTLSPGRHVVVVSAMDGSGERRLRVDLDEGAAATRRVRLAPRSTTSPRPAPAPSPAPRVGGYLAPPEID